jgi:hypothetical protein
LVKILDSWVSKEEQQKQSYLSRLKKVFAMIETRANEHIGTAIKQTIDTWSLGVLEQGKTDEPVNGQSLDPTSTHENSNNNVLVVKSSVHAEQFLRLSQEQLHTLLHRESRQYVNAVRKTATNARTMRFNELKEEIAKLGSRFQPELREEIITDLENLSSSIRQVAYSHIRESVRILLLSVIK